MAERRSIAWVPIIGALTVGGALIGVVVWQSNLQAIDREIRETRTGLKKLALSGRIPPTQEVMDHFTARQSVIEERYRHELTTVTSPPLAEATSANPQLSFQEQLRDVQRTLERLATARGMPVPEQLGFPKELPPSETVPRLLAQLALMRDAGTLIFEQGMTSFASLKVEDPESVPDAEGSAAFLMRVPVRVQLKGSLSQLMKVLGALERARPLIDVRGVRVVTTANADELEAELLLCRYLVTAAALEVSGDERQETSPEKSEPPAPRRSRQPAGTPRR
jgi:hypothetical protein